MVTAWPLAGRVMFRGSREVRQQPRGSIVMGRESGGELPHGAAARVAVPLSPTSPMQPA